jgi:hypothetical protein
MDGSASRSRNMPKLMTFRTRFNIGYITPPRAEKICVVTG